VASLYILAVFTLIVAREIGGFRLLTALILIEILIGIALDRLIAIKFEKS
jgi:hypothetical protein